MSAKTHTQQLEIVDLELKLLKDRVSALSSRIANLTQMRILLVREIAKEEKAGDPDLIAD